MDKTRLFEALGDMPDEAFGWVLLTLAHRTFPDGLGGFSNESQKSIRKTITIASVMIGMYGDTTNNMTDKETTNEPRDC